MKPPAKLLAERRVRAARRIRSEEHQRRRADRVAWLRPAIREPRRFEPGSQPADALVGAAPSVQFQWPRSRAKAAAQERASRACATRHKIPSNLTEPRRARLRAQRRVRDSGVM